MPEDSIIADLTKISTGIMDDTLTIPKSKLDADQYSADDLDGVTESLFGSGNMAYASLQASQTDAFMRDNAGADMREDSAAESNAFSSSVADAPTDMAASISNSVYNSDAESGTGISLGQNSHVTTDSSIPSGGTFTAATIGSIGASQLSSDIGSFSSGGVNLSLDPAVNGTNGDSGADGDTPQPPANGNDGEDGISVDIGGDTLIDIDIALGDTVETLNNVLTNLGDNIDTLVIAITDTIDTLTNILETVDIFNIIDLDIIGDIIQELHAGDIIQTVLTKVDFLSTEAKGLIEHILEHGEGTLEEITDLAHLNEVLDTLGGIGDTAHSTITQISDLITNLDLHDPSGTVNDTISTALNSLENLDGDISNALTTVNNITEGLLTPLDLGGDGIEGDGLISQTLDPVAGDILDITDDLTNNALGDTTGAVEDIIDDVTDIADTLTAPLLDGILGTNNDNEGGTDSDITADLGLGLLDQDIIDDTLEVALDPIEDLTGDLDLDIGLVTDLFGTDGNETDNDAGDSDITLDTNIDLVDHDILDAVSDTVIDPIEEITGDIDLEIDLAADVFGDLAAPLVNDGEGGTGEDTLLSGLGDMLNDTTESVLDGDIADDAALTDILSDNDLNIDDAIDLLGSTGDSTPSNDTEQTDNGWTESLSDGGGLFDDIIDGIGGETDALPDPVGTIAEGLGALDTDINIDATGIGGLFG